MTAGIRWLAEGPGSGFGDASEAYLSGLRSSGIPVSWTPLGWPSPVWKTPHGPVLNLDLDAAVHRDVVGAQIDHDTVVVCSTPLWHPQLPLEAKGRVLAAYTTWETDRLPADWVRILNRYDRVLVPSGFNASVFHSSGVTAPLEVVPHIARVPERTSSPHPRKDATFTFYVIATWTSRKAVLDVVAAYLAAFTGDDDVLLVVHTTALDLIAYQRQVRRLRPGHERFPAPDHRSATAFTLASALAGRTGVPEIKLTKSRLTRRQIEELHARCDCFVSLSRGEGWGLGAFDAAVFGNPVIVTGWGGTLEFLPGDYPYRVEYELVPTTSDEPDFWWRPRAGERWAKARVDHAAALMRHVFEHREEAADWGGVLQGTVTARFTESAVTRRLLEALEASRHAPR